MQKDLLRIATRKSPLALWQAEHVRDQLEALHPGLEVELLPMTTSGDELLSQPLSQVGGKGLFLKELERAMLNGDADMAVHSMKDVPPVLPNGLGLVAILERHTPEDAFVSNDYDNIDALPQGATVGTASLRRTTQLKALRPDLNITLLRGNLQTRLRKLDDGEYAAIILAYAGLERMGLADRIRQRLTADIMVPAVGQGALGLEARLDDPLVASLVQPLVCDDTTACVTAERTLSERLGGSCSVPIGAYATKSGDTLTLSGLVGKTDGSQVLTAELSGPASDAKNLGEQVANALIAQGAQNILDELKV
ncbi:MAG: hydroxymethylbilane synthase [Gammaproteobacteria bacterium]|nr:hydroxymethylbilane synthase [Gammaproteobacteria bacterium]